MTPDLTQVPFDVIDLLGDLRVVFHVFGDRADGVEDRGVVAAAEVAAYFFQAVPGVFAGEVHADLSWEGDGLVAFFALEVAGADVVVGGDAVDDLLDGDAALFGGAGFAEGGAGEFHVDLALLEHGHALD